MAKHTKSNQKTKRDKRRRPLSSFNRPIGQRQPGQCILVVCEGTKTEPNYFVSLRQWLRLASVQVEIKRGSGGASIVIVNNALRLQKERQRQATLSSNVTEFDEVWCVFDVERPSENASFLSAVNKAEENNLELAISNPAFEFWYLLHFRETARPFADADEVIGELRNYLSKYSKNAPVFAELYRLTSTAMERAKRLQHCHPDRDKRFPNPSTSVHELVEKLLSMAPPYMTAGS